MYDPEQQQKENPEPEGGNNAFSVLCGSVYKQPEAVPEKHGKKNVEFSFEKEFNKQLGKKIQQAIGACVAHHHRTDGAEEQWHIYHEDAKNGKPPERVEQFNTLAGGGWSKVCCHELLCLLVQ